MKIKKNVESPNLGMGRYCEASTAILDFIESDDINLKFECGGKEEAKRIYGTVNSFVRVKKLPVKVTKSMNDIYITRKVVE